MDKFIIKGSFSDAIRQITPAEAFKEICKHQDEKMKTKAFWFFILCNALKEDIYTIGEIKAIYKELFQKADIKEINPYSLKGIGFSVTPTVAYRNHDSLYECFKDLASKSNSEDVDKLKKRFAGSQVLRQALNDAAQQV